MSSSKIIDESDFQIIKEIGKGGYGNVFLVKDSDDNYWALKKFQNGDTAQVLREIDIMCRLDHPTIIGLRGYNFSGDDLSKMILVMEYKKNGSLLDIIQKENAKEIDSDKWNVTKKMIVTYGIAKGMEITHNNNILHRDLKPENILMNDNYEPCITDFGLSKVTDVQNNLFQSCVVGTPNYQSPEMKNNEPCNESSDVYSYGLIIYALFSGKQPNDNFPINMESLIENLPPLVQEIIECCCCEDKTDRVNFQGLVEYLKEPGKVVDGVNNDEYFEYVERIDNYKSKNTFSLSKILKSEAQLETNFSVNINADGLSSLGNCFLTSVEQISLCRTLIKFENEENYLLQSYKSIDEQQFIPQINIYSTLNHPVIPQLKCVSFSDLHNPMMVVKKIDYLISLDSIIKKGNSDAFSSEWNLTKKIVFLYGISKAMSYLHSKNIYIYNLNPEDIYLDKKFYPYIMNIELAINPTDKNENYESFKESSKSISIAPEFLESDPKETQNETLSDEKIDVFSFSILMFYVFTGKYQFLKSKALDLMNSIEDHVSIIPEDLCSLIKSCMSRNPSERPSFQEVSEKLSEIAQNLKGIIDIDEFNQYVSFIMSKEEETRLDVRYCKVDLEEDLKVSLKRSASNFIEAAKKYEQDSQYDKAVSYYKKAADKGDFDGNYHLALIYKNGAGSVKKSLMLAKANLLIAQEILQETQNDEFNEKVAEELNIVEEELASNPIENIVERANQGDPQAMQEYAWMLYNGIGFEKDHQKAFEFYKKAADGGMSKSMFNCALCFKNGDGTNKDLEKAATYFKMAADNGYASGMRMYGRMLKKGEGVEKDGVKAAYYFKMGADNGNVKAMNNYAAMLEDGDEIPRNMDEAEYYHKLSADNGDVNGMSNYATLYYIKAEYEKLRKPIKAAEYYKKAAEYYKYAADEGQAKSMELYARMLENGEGIEKNIDEAIKYYRRSAIKGNQKAKLALNRLTQA